jgi:hypothetical protein
MILFILLHWCKTWSATLRGNRLRVFENRALRILELKRVEVTGGWRKLHDGGEFVLQILELPN